MSRNNVYVLIATALLGILLVMVLRLSRQLTEIPAAEEEPAEIAETRPDTATAADPLPSPVPIVENYQDLVALLDSHQLPGGELLSATVRWYQARGFLGAEPMLGITADEAPIVYYESLDDATLEGLHQAQDLGATQVLASRRALVDPFAAVDLYKEAAALGSAYAYLQLASLHDTLSAVRSSDLSGNPEMASRLQDMRDNARLRAFGYAMAALRDSGAPLADEPVVAWINRLHANLPEGTQELACRESEKLLLEIGARRRSMGLAPANSTPPPVFLTVPDLRSRLPCSDTEYAFYSMLDTDDCASEPVLDGKRQDLELFVCL